MDYRIGLDIGITSVGWAVLENNSMGEPKRIVDLGVRIFDAAEDPQDGSSLAAPRRAARSARRRLRRRRHRSERLKQLFEENGLIRTEEFMKRYGRKGLPDVYQLRYEALERVLTGEELAQVLLHIAKHRGFQSNRRSELEEKEAGRVLEAISENEHLMLEKKYRTVGEMLYLDDKFKIPADGEGQQLVQNTRNHGGDYRHTIKRSLLVQEIDTIFEMQRGLGNSLAGEKLQQDYLHIMLGQRSFDMGPGNPSPYAGNLIQGMIGRCIFEKEEYRAAKACFTAERFVMLQKLSHLRIRDAKGDKISLEEHFAEIVDMAYQQKKVTYANIRKKLGLGTEYLFVDLNYNETAGKRKKAVQSGSSDSSDVQEQHGQRIAEAGSNDRSDSLKENDGNTAVLSSNGNIDKREDNIRKAVAINSSDSINNQEKAFVRGDELNDNCMTDSREKTIKRTEQAVCIELKHFHEIREALGEYDLSLLQNSAFIEFLDEIGRILTWYKNDDSREEELRKLEVPEHLETEEEWWKGLLSLNPAKFQHLSVKAMRKIIPFLEQGLNYNAACEEAGYDFKAEIQGEKRHLLKGKEIKELIDEIPNPVVKRAVSQTFKVINAIIGNYGSPQEIHIELARDISKKLDERKSIEKKQKDNQKANERVMNQLKELGFRDLKDRDVLKYKLWQEQGECCMYSGEHIPLEKLFTDKYAEVDHIIPYSKSFDNSYSNKVLVLARENQNKGNRLPYEAFGSDTDKWGRFEYRVKNYVKDYNKRNRLLKQQLTDEDIKAFKQRNINDTRYITTLVKDIIEGYLEFAPYTIEGRVRRVIPVNGRITNFLRVRWGLAKKDRSTDTHHAVDAVLVACCTQGMVQKITRNLQAKEIGYKTDLAIYDEETGETIYRSDYTDETWILRFGRKIPLPWEHFNDELDFRMSPDPDAFIRNFPKEYARFGYPEGEEDKIRPLFVSRMPRHKVSGAERADTIRSPRHFEEEGIVVSKVPLTDLKLGKDGEIERYYKPETDRLLYEALKAQLTAYDGKAAEAFKENFYKPKADGSKGPLVRKVKVVDRLTIGVYVNRISVCNQGIKTEKWGGIAANANGAMIRVDVFCEDGKYYFVPIYVSDTRKRELPNKAAVAAKPYSKWKEMKNENFIFSLYPNDLFYFKHKQGMKGKTSHNEPCVINEQICYFKGANISTASFAGILHDSGVLFEGLGIQRLLQLKKYQVDVLGNISEVRREMRRDFH